MNAMKQAKINGWASSTDAKNSCTFFHEWEIRKRFAYESPIEELYYDRSVVPMEKPLGKMEIGRADKRFSTREET